MERAPQVEWNTRLEARLEQAEPLLDLGPLALIALQGGGHPQFRTERFDDRLGCSRGRDLCTQPFRQFNYGTQNRRRRIFRIERHENVADFHSNHPVGESLALLTAAAAGDS